MSGERWQLQEAKNRFSEVVDHALKHGPQIVTKHGKPAVVILSTSDYDRISGPRRSLAAALRECPVDLTRAIEARSKETARSIRFD